MGIVFQTYLWYNSDTFLGWFDMKKCEFSQKAKIPEKAYCQILRRVFR